MLPRRAPQPGGPRIGIVHDWLDTWRGGENVLAELLGMYPGAEVFTLVDFLPTERRAALAGATVSTSFLQHLPAARRHFRAYLPLFPSGVRSLDVSRCDIVISVSHAVAKGVATRPDQLHLCYCLTPVRYAWDLRPAYLETVQGRIPRAMLGRVLDRLRRWDAAMSRDVDVFVAISRHVRERIRRCYGREATVIHPPVDVDYFTIAEPAPRDAPYVTASRWVPYKRIDLIVAAFAALPGRRLIVAGDGPDAVRIRRSAPPNVQFVGELDRAALRELLRSARAFVFAADEDFGMLPVEAQACGTPVIAYGRGGALETVRPRGTPGATGILFDRQDPAAIADAVRTFEAGPPISPADCRAQAERFSQARFRAAFDATLTRAWAVRDVQRRIMRT
jgi:glycosyltransferase involved in cell wall biosynthesis